MGRNAGDEGVAVGWGIRGWIEVKFCFLFWIRVYVFFVVSTITCPRTGSVQQSSEG